MPTDDFQIPNDATVSTADIQASADLSDTNLSGAKLREADLTGASLCGASLIDADLSNAQLKSADLSNANLSNADLSSAKLKKADLSEATLTGTNLQRVNLDQADLSNADLSSSDLTHASILYANLRYADLSAATLNHAEIGCYNYTALAGAEPTDMSHTYLRRAKLRNTDLIEVNLSKANLKEADLCGATIKRADLSDSRLTFADLSGSTVSESDFTRAKLHTADLSGVRATMDGPDTSQDNTFKKANLISANLENATMQRSDFTDATLSGADLTAANLEKSNLTRATLFGAELADCRTHGATFTDTQINDRTVLGSDPKAVSQPPWWKIWTRLQPDPAQRCIYDALNPTASDSSATDMGKAADTYRSYEQLAGHNARPGLQSSMFTLRQDIQLRRHRRDGHILKMNFYRLNRWVFKYGESIGRTIATGISIILFFALIYLAGGLIEDASGTVIMDFTDTLYFSTMTFTTLGMGDFQPVPTSDFARLLVTAQAAIGAVLIAIFVYVLGRRSTR